MSQMRIDSIQIYQKPQQNEKKEDAALKKACREFESVLVAQMLKNMRSSVQKSDLFGSSEKEEMFQGMLDDEIAKDISRTNSFGIAQTLYNQLSQIKTAKVSEKSVDTSIESLQRPHYLKGRLP